jgi:tetratricopeptide (TPR) repeat protein
LALSRDILERCIEKFGESSTALTNLAKAQSGLGYQALAAETLLKSLRLDPNQNAGLMWYLKQREEQSGAAGIQEALNELAAWTGSWRAQLWLARNALGENRPEEALGLYRRALASGYDSDGLLMISGDLGKHQLPTEAIEFVRPRFDPNLHDHNIGVNLLQACLDLGRIAEGEEILSQLRNCAGRSLEDQWAWYAAEFAKLKLNPAGVGQPTPYREEVEEAVRAPGGRVYRIAGYTGPAAQTPTEAIVGMWKVNMEGKISGNLIRNPSYDPIRWPGGEKNSLQDGK